jgi:hypothetical protein
MSSGYFSRPSAELDPALFSGTHLKDDVRTGLLNVLYGGLERDLDFNDPWDWVHAWVAGSGISYQWSADRGNGDLDVLFGADYTEFLRANPQFPRLTMEETSMYVNQMLKLKLWPRTSHYDMGGKAFEVTFYWNPTTGTSIENIHPYAAYDLVNDCWVVRPPELPDNPRSLYPQQWHDTTERDFANTWAIQDLYHSGPSGKLQGVNAARALWRDIHEGRKQAFGDLGSGYGDFHNYRWQRAKETGASDILRFILDDADQGRGSDDGPHDILTRDAIRYASSRYTG